MDITVNGTTRTCTGAVSVADLVADLGVDPAARGIAVARNGEVVPRAAWADTTLTAGDLIEILTAAQGG